MDYKVNIFAHNEEELIESCIDSLLKQTIDSKDKLIITVIANGCDDDTENIVLTLMKKNNALKLFTIKEGGKVNALRVFLDKYFINIQQLNSDDLLFFMDADVVIVDKNVLKNLAQNVLSRDALYAVSAHGVPESCFNNNNDFVSILFRMQAEIQQVFKYNKFRGALYCIKSKVAKKITLPKNLMSDDIFFEISLDGHFSTDYNSIVVYKLHEGIKKEIRRNFMHCLGVLQAYRLLHEGKISKIDNTNQVNDFKSKYYNKREIVFYLLKKLKLITLFVLFIHNIYYKFNCFKARKVLDTYGTNTVDLSVYWRTRK